MLLAGGMASSHSGVPLTVVVAVVVVVAVIVVVVIFIVFKCRRHHRLVKIDRIHQSISIYFRQKLLETKKNN